MRIFSFIVSVMVALTLRGQSVTITQSFNEPVIGDVDKSYRIDTSGFTNGLPMNIMGPSCVWNFQNLAGAFPMVIDSFISISAATGGSAYPNGSYAQHRDLLYTFYKSNPQQTELLGAYSPSLSITFSDYAIIANYPINFGYNVSDPVSGTFKYNTTTGACNGNITVSADSYGTLNLPGGVTFTNVLRLKSVEILTLTIGILPFGTFNQTIYNFYVPGKKFPILNMNYTTYSLIAGTPTTTAFLYGNSDYFTVLGMNEHSRDRSYIVFPNPFHDQLCVESKYQKEDSECTLYDVNGKMALRTRFVSDIDTEALDSGVYLLEIKNSKGVHRQKVIKN